MRHSASLICFLLTWLLGLQLAYAADPVELLVRANKAAQKLNYTGNYLYQHGEHNEVLRVSHRVDGRTERQKVEVLDGPRREFIRINEEVYCHLADGKTVRFDKSAAQRFFPAVVPNEVIRLTQYYIPKLGGTDKVAGRECQIVILEPRDENRYAHMIWIDQKTGLPLKTQTVDNHGSQVSMYVFSEIEIGKQPDKSLFDIRMAGKRKQLAGVTAGAQDDVWKITLPPGYTKILEAIRPLPGVSTPVLHSVYSDGMSSISVFIEPLRDANAGMEGLSTEGAINIYSRRVTDHKVTAIGEVPPAALLDTANSVQKK